MRIERFSWLLLTIISFNYSLGQRSVIAQQRGMTLVMPDTGSYAGQQFYTNSHALLIGISRYPNLPKDKWLNYGDDDALAMRECLIRSYGFAPRNVNLLLNERATKANIEAELAAFSDGNTVGKDDRLLVYFAGHGQTLKLPPRFEGDRGGDMGVLLPYDAKVDLDHPENRSPYIATCIQMSGIWDYLQASPAKHVLLLVDACYSGLLVRGGDADRQPEKPNRQSIQRNLSRSAMQVLTAGGRGEHAIEDPKWGHGAFTYKLLKELSARAGVSDDVFYLSELAVNIKNSVENLTNGKQTPQFGKYADTEGEFVFVTTKPQSVPPPASGADDSLLTPVVTTELHAGSIKINPKDGAEMVWVPAGEFLMGSPDTINDRMRRLQQAAGGEFKDDWVNQVNQQKPQKKVYLDGFWIYKHEVTIGQYLKFLQSPGYHIPPAMNWLMGKDDNDNHPMVNVDWQDAKDYCEWAGVSLPTEAQWEKAARGTDGRTFVWGEAWPPPGAANLSDEARRLSDPAAWAADAAKYHMTAIAGYNDGFATTAPVGACAGDISAFGVMDMAGNVSEWCEDEYRSDYYAQMRARNPIPPQPSPQRDLVGRPTLEYASRVVRGGSFVHSDPVLVAVAARGGYTAMESRFFVGFRCVQKP